MVWAVSCGWREWRERWFMAVSNDLTLLHSYARTHDAEAFATLFRRYVNLVYGTCLRVTHNPADAEDAAQETFLELARKAEQVNTSLAGWLHRAATHRAANTIREASRRRHREAVATAERSEIAAAAEPTWREIAPQVDKALDDLDEELRLPVILHFLHGKSQEQIADELGVHRSTVSRRIERGVNELRGKLRMTCLAPSAAVLMAMMAGKTACEVPATLLAGLGKMAIAGVGTVSGPAVAGAVLQTSGSVVPGVVSSTLGSLKAKAIVAAATALLALGTYGTYRYAPALFSSSDQSDTSQTIQSTSGGEQEDSGWKTTREPARRR